MAQFEIKDGVAIIPEGITEIGEDTFYDCVSLESVIIPESVEGIGECAFYGSGKYSKVSLSGVTIGSEAFRFCGITELTLEKCKLNDASAFINNKIEKLAILETDIPDDMKELANEYHDKMIESVAETDDTLLDKFFMGEELTIDEIKKALAFNEEIRHKYSIRFLAIKLLEKDKDVEK